MSTKHKNPGRKPKLSVDEINELIYLYKSTTGMSGKIKYSDMYLFNKQAVKEGKFHTAMGEDFWRKPGRLGRELIDKANKVFSNNLLTSENKEVAIPNVVDLINKNHSNKDELIKSLIPMERELYSSINRENKLHKKLKEKENEINSLKAKNKEINTRNDSFQDLLFQMLRYSSYENTSLKEQLNLNDNKNLYVAKALEDIFDSPDVFYSWYENKKQTKNNESNVVPIKKGHSLADEYNDLF